MAGGVARVREQHAGTGGQHADRVGGTPLPSEWSAIFDRLVEGVLVTTKDGRRLYSNPALDRLVEGDGRLPLGSGAPPAFLGGTDADQYAAFTREPYRGPRTSVWRILPAGRPAHLVEVTLTRLPSAVDGPVLYCWVFSGSAPAPEVDPHRDLAGALRRIGLEVLHAGLLDGLAGDAPVAEGAGLTPAEAEVVSLLVRGYRVPDIAERLYVSVHTVRNRLKSAYRKTGTHSQVELVAWARGNTVAG